MAMPPTRETNTSTFGITEGPVAPVYLLDTFRAYRLIESISEIRYRKMRNARQIARGGNRGIKPGPKDWEIGAGALASGGRGGSCPL